MPRSQWAEGEKCTCFFLNHHHLFSWCGDNESPEISLHFDLVVYRTESYPLTLDLEGHNLILYLDKVLLSSFWFFFALKTSMCLGRCFHGWFLSFLCYILYKLLNYWWYLDLYLCCSCTFCQLVSRSQDDDQIWLEVFSNESYQNDFHLLEHPDRFQTLL